mgnify:CR=1 FL=1
MISNDGASFSIIVQGGLSPRTEGIINGFREMFPKCQLILSTWSPNKELLELVDEYIVNGDPGSRVISVDELDVEVNCNSVSYTHLTLPTNREV